ncbi:hypothetical protein Bca4012_100721 [Brassica carinata]
MAISTDGSAAELGNTAVRSSSGGWKSARLIIFVEMAERFAYFGVSSNLIMYLTGPLGQPTAAAAANVNVWIGTMAFLPLLWAFVADGCLGRFRTIIILSSLYILDKAVTNRVLSITTTRLVSTYIQENLSWSFGFEGKKNPFARIGRVFMEAIKNRRQKNPDIANANETLLLLAKQSSEKFRFLDRAAISCELPEIEEAKSVLRLVPIWITCLVYAIVNAQSPTFFTKQGAKMDRSISPGLVVPAAALQCFINISVIVFIPVYDCLFVPITRSFTHIPSGITMLQRIGTGIVLSVISMYVLYGVADGFTMAGLQEFFYDQVPSELRSVGMAMNLSIYGAGNFLSSFMISVIDRATSQSGQTSWFDNDLNKAHLDYFYWLLASLSFIGFAFYMWFAKSYVYNRSNT